MLEFGDGLQVFLSVARNEKVKQGVKLRPL